MTWLGDIVTKLDTAEMALSYGIPVILAHGEKPRSLETLALGNQKETVFFA
jgi:glutamate 5-kinase